MKRAPFPKGRCRRHQSRGWRFQLGCKASRASFEKFRELEVPLWGSIIDNENYQILGRFSGCSFEVPDVG